MSKLEILILKDTEEKLTAILEDCIDELAQNMNVDEKYSKLYKATTAVREVIKLLETEESD